MRGFKDSKSVADIGSRGDAEPANLSGSRVGDVVAVEVSSGQHAVVRRADDDLLKDGVGNAVVDENLALPCAVAVALADRFQHALDFGVQGFAEGRIAEFEAGFDEGRILFNRDAGIGIHVAQNPAFALGHGLRAELLNGNLVAPFAKCAFSELLNVALVDKGNGLASRLQRVTNGVAHQPLGTEDGDGLDSHTGVFADFLLAALEQVVI